MPRTFDPYALTTPCSTCPFRKDRFFFLEPAGVLEIAEQTNEVGFSCHNTVDYTEEDPDGMIRNHDIERQCAGHLIIREKMGRPSTLMKIMQVMGQYDPSKLDMSAPVYDSFDEYVEAINDRRKYWRLRKAHS